MKEQYYDHKTISKETGIKYDYLGKIFNGLKWSHIVSDYNITNNKHFYPKEIRERIINLINDGYSNKEIREKIGYEFNIELKKSYIKYLKQTLKNHEGSTTIESVLRIEID